MKTKQVDQQVLQVYVEGRETILIDKELFDELVLNCAAHINKKALKERYANEISSIAVFLTMCPDDNYMEGLHERINMFIMKMNLDTYSQQLLQNSAEERVLDGSIH